MAVTPDRLVGMDTATADKAAVTPTNGLELSGKNLQPVYGQVAGTVAQGNDSRFGKTVAVVLNGNAGALALGDAVYKNGTAEEVDLADADALATARVVGLVADASIAIGASGNVASDGLLVGAGTFGTVGGKVYLASGGVSGATLTQTPPSGAGKVVIPVGYAKNGTDLLIQIGEPIEL